MAELTGAQILIECLLKENVEVVFGLPGGQALPIFDAIHGSKLNFILARHEQAAGHMADGYARSTGKPGVCIVTSGPGATNIVTPLATAYMDSVPLVAFSGQVSTAVIGQDAFQEADITGITRPVTKHNFLVKDVKDLARTIKEAFYIASTGRPGPVLVDIPVDVQRGICELVYPEKVSIRSYKPNYNGHPGQIKKAASIINESKNPVFYIGTGVVVSNAEKEILEISKKADIPVTNTLLAVGAYPHDTNLSLGMLGMHGTYAANKAVQAADVIIAVGARFDDRCTGKVCDFAKAAKIIHVDIDPTAISKVVETDIPVVGDAKKVLEEMSGLVESKKRADWIKKIDAWKAEHPLGYERNDDKLHPQYVIEKISELTKGEAVITTEVGQHQMWSAQYYKAANPRLFVSSGGLGTMGFGFPAAIGAKFGNPTKEVIAVAGDGSFQMNMQEMAIAILNDVNVKVVILNNQYLGNVRQWQEMFYGKRYSHTCLAKRPACPSWCNSPDRSKCPVYVPDFVKWAESYGALGIRVTHKKDVEGAIKKMLEAKNSVVLDVWVEIEENIFPMVPAGKSLDEIITRIGG
ncbi:biosynthetic-type acetolactate synthase large subunit [Endomicrobium proavitum]|uniref:Acetolactate synthase n=1 Tax=Endomicrobium proavitum TaxID=1408281 RepID=A0A0G3WM54_9BACT|nr:biosynthetic-type acetolactate synthase large subunit [Endomicrobium proavitum]AKL98549.1 acetolactate synthase III, large subunit [Endomicrobium proavitum]